MKYDKKELRLAGTEVCVGGLSEKGIGKKTNQDSFKIGICPENEMAYIIVADGLGSCRNSEQGSQKVIEILENWILNRLPQYSFLSDSVANIMLKRLVEEWNKSYDVQEISQYDTTVHLAIFYKKSALIGGIGDGMALLKCNDYICRDCIDKMDLFSNVTNSMCSINVTELMTFEIIREVDTDKDFIVILSTDGISDDLIPEKKLTLPDYFLKVMNQSGGDSLQSELAEWIRDWETESHSDDKTLCYLAITGDQNNDE